MLGQCARPFASQSSAAAFLRIDTDIGCVFQAYGAGVFVAKRHRKDASGFSIVDLWTGERAVIAMRPQSEMSKEDAEHTADMLNTRARKGDRSVLQ